MERKMILVALGNVFDGLQLWGPFEDVETATRWAEREIADWHIVYVNPV